MLRAASPSSLPPTTSLKPPSSMHTFQNQTNKKINITEAEKLEKIEEIFQRISIVLIAEDTPSVQRTLAFAFTKNNIPFILVGDGSEVVNAFQGRDIHVVSTNLKSTKSSDFQIKALLSDEQMPNLNGSEALQQIRPRNPDLIAYSYTSTCDPGSPDADAAREKLQKLGFNAVFGKKTPPKDLIAPFKKALNIS
jgi:CheY-like chemotaxis protein